MTLASSALRTVLGAGLAVLLSSSPVAAIESVELSLDTTTDFGTEVLGPEEVGEDDLAGDVTFTGVGVSLPLGVDTVAFHRLPGGEVLFAVDTTVALADGLFVTPRDVVRAGAKGASLALDGAALGVPAGARVDALSTLPNGDLLVSFDVTTVWKGEAFADEDVVQVDADGSVSPFFQAAMVGIDPALDLDALHRLANGKLLASFDGTGSVDGVTFADEDLLAIDLMLGQVTGLAYEPSSRFPSVVATDLDAAFAHELDGDGDGVPDSGDNCADVPNPDQSDANAFEDDDTSLAGIQHYGDACDADLNEDGVVAPDDFFGHLRPCLGATAPFVGTCGEADFDGDGFVGPSDFFSLFRPSIGQSPGPGVTEPGP